MMKKSNKKTASVLTFGCQMNIHDSEYIKANLEDFGYELVEDYNSAGLIVINTCSVRDKPEQKLSNILSQIKGLKTKPVVIICGCTAQQLGENIIQKFPIVDIVIGPDELFNFKHILEEYLNQNKSITATNFYDNFSYETTRVSSKNKNQAYLTVMKGCNSFCSYCIVPYLRGREISRSKNEIVEDIKNLVTKGVNNICIVAQNISRYGLDINNNLINLLYSIAEIKDLKRLSFLTSHPKDFNTDLIKCFEEIKILDPVLHLPAQHGSNKILKLMNRRYTKEDYLKIVEKLKKSTIWDSLNFTTDIIIGFPGEEEADFKELMDLLNIAEFDNSYTFIYSPRKGTSAYELYGNSVKPELKKLYSERLKIYQDRQKEISLQKNKNLIDSLMELYIESESYKDSSKFTARTKSNKIVNIKKTDGVNIGDYVIAKIDSAAPTHLSGTFIKK